MAHTQETKDRIFAFWDRGDSAGYIAEQVGISRCAVIGIVSRSGRSRTTVVDRGRRRARMVKTDPIKIRVNHNAADLRKPAPAEEPEPVGPLADFPPFGGCQFIRGPFVTGNWRMCGHPSRQVGSRWCAWHAENEVFAK